MESAVPPIRVQSRAISNIAVSDFHYAHIWEPSSSMSDVESAACLSWPDPIQNGVERGLATRVYFNCSTS